jgi:2-oxoisovalerate dehydrogenase E1 component alpha subunit
MRPELEHKASRQQINEVSTPRASHRQRSDDFPLHQVISDDGGAEVGPVSMTGAELVRLYRWMVLSRLLDERMVGLQRQGRIGFYVAAFGEEASIVGSAAAMAEGDWLFPCYREHAAALYRGLPLSKFVCNLLGNGGDLVLGHQMPCHEGWRPGNFLSISSPVGTQIPQAVGAAWAARIRREEMVSLVYFGDGATSTGDFHVALNFAGVRKVPTVFLCRNNGWAISTPLEAQTASESIAQKAVAYGIRGERVDGNDLVAVHDVVRRARARAAAGDGPTLVECVTYRVEAHSTSDDPGAYRPEELVEPWRKKDPILRMRRVLDRRGLLDEAGEARLTGEVRDEIERAIAEAETHAPKPPLETLVQGVYAEPLWQQREQLEAIRAGLADDEEDEQEGSEPAGA